MSRNYRQYEIWHDETKKEGYYHGILLVPLQKRREIISLLKQIRRGHNYSDSNEIKFAGCLNKTKPGRFVNSQLGLFSHIIKTSPRRSFQIFNRTGKDIYEKNFDPILTVSDCYDCRFGLLKVKNLQDTLDYFSGYKEKVETTFRFVIKGCCHGMFNDVNPVELTKFYFDGADHYKGTLDTQRMIRGEWQDYCKVPDNLPVDDRSMDQRNDQTKLVMNLVDSIVGGWRALLNEEDDPNDVLFPLKKVYKRAREGKIFANPNSRWYKSISFSEFTIEDGEIKFPSIFRNEGQASLFNN